MKQNKERGTDVKTCLSYLTQHLEQAAAYRPNDELINEENKLKLMILIFSLSSKLTISLRSTQ